MLAGKGLEEGLAQARAEIFLVLPSSKDLNSQQAQRLKGNNNIIIIWNLCH
jgi:hypothetical protein